uniref:MATH domain and coiled-coil domain-containing protein At3g58440 n=1 Tax=Arabidopsis thaliana TaxID=3702 RepID=MCC31_ARATH|nr:RecName: Full=MATH domain and coiled-coil domain-containing protein At3g58440; AltName: Full=RTM3-like protein At3g58440 [Arabidopsis thaliana]
MSLDLKMQDKFTWVLEKFSSLKDQCYSPVFTVAGCNWRLLSFLKGAKNDRYFSVYLDLEPGSLPPGWRREVKFSITLDNVCPNTDRVLGGPCFFDAKSNIWGFQDFLLLEKLVNIAEGFLVNDRLTIVAEVDVLPSITRLHLVLEDASRGRDPNTVACVTETCDYVLMEIQSDKETVDINGFVVVSSKAESVRRILERHPDISVEFRGKNQQLRNACMNFLLSLIETMCQSLEELSNEDLVEADVALTYLRDAGFKVDWLEKKLDQLKEKKEEEMSGLARLHEIEERLQKLKLLFVDLESQLQKEKVEALVARAPLSFNDGVCRFSGFCGFVGESLFSYAWKQGPSLYSLSFMSNGTE